MQNPELIEQLKIRKVVDGRTESSGRALVCTPPSNGGRSWMVLKLQGLLQLEFKEKKIPKNPNDLEPGDLGCDSRAPRKKRSETAGACRLLASAQTHRLSLNHSSRSFSGAGKPRGRGRKRPQPEWDPEEEWPVEAILDKRVASKEDNIEGVIEGDILYLVAWEGWDSSYNSWQPESGISDDLIEDYERRADEAEAEADGDALEEAEEAAAAAEASGSAVEGTGVPPTPIGVNLELQTSEDEVSCTVALPYIASMHWRSLVLRLKPLEVALPPSHACSCRGDQLRHPLIEVLAFVAEL